MVKKLVIAGASGNALDVMDIVDAINARGPEWEIAGLLDDGKNRGDVCFGLPVLGGMSRAGELKDCWFVLTMGSDLSYQRRAEMVEKMGTDRFATLVHPLACVSKRASLGAGTCVNFGVSVAGNVKVEDHVFLGPRVVVGHDSVIGSHSVIAAGAVISGAVTIGKMCYIGASASIKQKVAVGERALVGMGAVVLKNVEEGKKVVGNPARVL